MKFGIIKDERYPVFEVGDAEESKCVAEINIEDLRAIKAAEDSYDYWQKFLMDLYNAKRGN